MKKRLLKLLPILAVLLCLLAIATSAATINVGTADELVAIMDDSTTWASGNTINLTADIDLTGKTQQPIGNATTSFRGTFNGNGHTISGLNIDITENYAALFGQVYNGIVKNVIVKGTVKSTGSGVGGIVGCATANSTITGCISYVNVSGVDNIGGIVGTFYHGSTQTMVKNCINYGNITASSLNAGGIVGRMYANGTSGTVKGYIAGCENHGTVEANYRVGGIVGSTQSASTTTATVIDIIEGCRNYGAVSATATTGTQTPAGGILGANISNSPGADSYINITHCENNGAVTGRAVIGGIFGGIRDTSSVAGYSFVVESCVNNGTVTSTISDTSEASYVGGIGGFFLFDYNAGTNGATVKYCQNNGAVVAAHRYVGGIVGLFRSKSSKSNAVKVIGCINKGEITSTRSDGVIGGIVGNAIGSATTHLSAVASCYNAGTIVNSGSHRGPIIGNHADITLTYTDNYYLEISGVTYPSNNANLLSSTTKVTAAASVVASNYSTAFTNEMNITANGPEIKAYSTVAGTKTVTYPVDLQDVMFNAKFWKYDVTLAANISMAGYIQRPIGTEAVPYNGTFDGADFAINNLNIVTDHTMTGLIGNANNITVKNLTVRGNVESSAGFVGGIVGHFTGDLVFRTVTNAATVSGNNYVGGLIGGTETDSASSVSVWYAVNVGNVTAKGCGVGGIAGWLIGSTANKDMALRVCRNSGDITGVYQVAGIVGRFDAKAEGIGGTFAIDRCRNGGTITSTGSGSGGAYTGGIVGLMTVGDSGNTTTSPEASIYNCMNLGAIVSTHKYTGGIVGLFRAYVDNKLSLHDCWNTGSVYTSRESTNDATVAGIIGSANSGTAITTIENCYNEGSIKSGNGNGTAGVIAAVNSQSVAAGTVSGLYYLDIGETYAPFNNAAVNVKVTEANRADMATFVGFTTEYWAITKTGPELKNYHTCVYVWQGSGTSYALKCTACAEQFATSTTAPVVYLEQATGNDANDGLTAATAVATIEEAAMRLSITGGQVVLPAVYKVSENINLPAYEKEITFTSKDSTTDYNTGFRIQTHGITINLAGPTKFEEIVFNGSGTSVNNSDGGYYNIPVICANYNDLTMGIGIHAYGVIYIVVGSQIFADDGITQKNLGGKTVNITLNRATAHAVTSGGTTLTEARATYDRVYLGDRVRHNSEYTVSNLNVNFVSNNATFNHVYLATSSSKESNAQMVNCKVNAVFNGETDAYIKYLSTGDQNTMHGTAYLEEINIELNGTAYVQEGCAIRNFKKLDFFISNGSDRTASTLNRERFYLAASAEYLATNPTGVANITYGTHSFAKGVAYPTYNDIYTVTENVIDECVWGEGEVTTAPTFAADGERAYTCSTTTCGRTKTAVEEYVPAGTIAAENIKYLTSVVLTSGFDLEFPVELNKAVAADSCLLKIESYAAGAAEPKVTVVEPYKTTEKDEAVTYRFEAPSVAAKEMNDRVVVTFLAVVGGEEYVAASSERNIVSYYEAAYALWGNESQGQAPAMMATLNAMLNYGAAAQSYFGYNEENLVNEHLPAEEQKTAFEAEATATESVDAESCSVDAYVISELSAVLKNKVIYSLKFTRANTDAAYDKSGIIFKGSYNDINGVAKTIEVSGDSFVEASGAITVDIDSVAAKDLRQMITGALYLADGTTQISDTIEFSFECYANKDGVKSDAGLKNICSAILNYCDAAMSLFKK